MSFRSPFLLGRRRASDWLNALRAWGYSCGIRWRARQENSELFFTQPERHICIEADEAVLQRHRKKSSRIIFHKKSLLIVLNIIRTSGRPFAAATAGSPAPFSPTIS
jgi:hypothetical protein